MASLAPDNSQGIAWRPLTLPNAITMVRALASPPVVFYLLSRLHTASLPLLCIYFALFALDAIDGFVARACHQVSILGAFLDPLADKVLIFCSYAGLLWNIYGLVEIQWFILLAATMAWRLNQDAQSTAAYLEAIRSHRPKRANFWGKAKTCTESVGILTSTICLRSGQSPFHAILPMLVGAVAAAVMAQMSLRLKRRAD